MKAIIGILLLAMTYPLAASPVMTERCAFDYVLEAESGHYVAQPVGERCRDRIIAHDLAKILPGRDLGGIQGGIVTLASATVNEGGETRGRRVYRWSIVLPEGMVVPATVSTRFTRLETSQPIGPSLRKCNITPNGFDILLIEKDGSELFDVELEWIAYELSPPATPLDCNEPGRAR